FSEAEQILHKGADDDLAAKNTDRAAIKWTSDAYSNLLAGRKQEALSASRKALSLSKAIAVRFLAARVLVDGGAIDEGRMLAASVAGELPAEPHALGRNIEGLIAARTGNVRDAIAILGDANSILDTWFGHFDLGRAYLEADAFPQADAEFDRCIERRGETLSL